MKPAPRNFSALGSSSAAAVNAGTIGVQKDKIVYVDPDTEILYDPEENIRNGKVVDDGIEGLIALRLAMDSSEQLQPIRIYPLGPDKLDPSKPNLKYGIGYGHRRTLCCRLTKKDHELIGDKPRKVAAIIDVEWLSRGRAYRRRCQIQENTHRLDLNPVELGQAIREYQEDLAKEEGRVVPQRELMDTFRLTEKTIYALLKAADFHQIAKDVCHRSLLRDLDTMVTFDAICKLNEELGRAIFDSLSVEGAPANRTFIRQAKAMAEQDGYVFDAESWAWPDSVAGFGNKPAQVVVQQVNVDPQVAGQAPAVQQQSALREPGEAPAGQNSQLKTGAGGPGAEQSEAGGGSPNTAPSTDKLAEPNPAGQQKDGPQTAPQTPSGPATTASPKVDAPAPIPSKEPIIMVSFKMGAEATRVFTGELLLADKAKSPNSAVVAYLADQGNEEKVDVPLKFIELVSISHQ